MQKIKGYLVTIVIVTIACGIAFILCSEIQSPVKISKPKALLIPGKKFYFNSFVDCNMAEAWIADTFRIFPGKYGEDPLWGYARDLKFADGYHADEE